MEEWSIYKIEGSRNDEKFVIYLEQLLSARKIKEIFRAIKMSGVYLSYNVIKAGFKQQNRIKDFLFVNLYSSYPDKVEKLLEEIQTLDKIQQKVISKVDGIYKQISKEKQAYYLIESFNNLFKEMTNKSLQLDTNLSDISDLNETMVMSLGMVLKDMMFRKIPFLITDKPEHNDLNIIGKHLEVASELRAVNNIIEAWMFGDIELTKDIVSQSVKINETGNFGKYKLMTQIPFLDLKEAKNGAMNYFLSKNEQDIQSTLILGRESLESRIKEYFYTEDFTQKYKNIPLIDWINSYWCLHEYSLRFILAKNTNTIYHSFEEWESIFRNGGVSQPYIHDILKQLTFTKKSKDLYDSPLLEFSGGLVCITNMIPNVDIARSLISQFGVEEDKNNSTGLNKKGTNFENHIRELTERNIKTTLFNRLRHRKSGTYEIDLIFQLDENIFFIECKTQKQPGTYRDFQRNQDELRNYIKKFNRNVDYYLNNKNEMLEIMKELGISSYKNVYKIFVTNVYQIHNFIEDVYIVDEINYYCYMKRQSPKMHYINNDNHVIINMDSYLYEGNVNTNQFLAMIKNKEYNSRLLKRIGNRTVDLDKKLGFTYICYYIEIPAYQYSNRDQSYKESLLKLRKDYL